MAAGLRRMVGSRTTVAVALAVIAAGFGCAEPIAPPEPVASVSLSQSATIALVPGGTEQVQATARDAVGNVLTGRVAVWTSSDESVARVVAGVITGVGTGTADITVAIEGKTAGVSVHVVDGAAIGASGGSVSVLDGAVSVSIPAAALAQTRNISIVPAASPPANVRLLAASAFDVGPASITFSQPATITLRYDPSKVDSDSPESGLRLYTVVNGVWRVIAGSTVDTARKTVTGDVGQLGTFGVLMQARVATITLSQDTATIRTKRTLQFSAILKDDEGFTLSRAVAWSTSDPAILSIGGSSGLATGVFPGDASVTAVAEGKSATALVKVISGPADNLTIIYGNGQSGGPSMAVAATPAVRVTDSDSIPVIGVPVVFSVLDGGGTVTGANQVTNSAGVAQVGSWILGDTAGVNRMAANAGAITGSPAIFSATVVIAPPVAIAVNAGNLQTASAGTPVPIPPSVLVTDALGKGVARVNVTFSIRSGGGSITGANAVTNAEGIATVGSWTLGLGGNSLDATAAGLSGSPVTFLANGLAFVRLTTFGDSNTDIGYAGTDPTPRVASYVSAAAPSARLAPTAPNSNLQLAGKIEARWRANRSQTITVVNHAIIGTSTGPGRDVDGGPHAREQVLGVTRFEGEVLGDAYPWSGDEVGWPYPNGPLIRVQAYTPRPVDFLYISMGTNDVVRGFAPQVTVDNLEWMIDQWIARGLPAANVMLATLPPRTPQLSVDIPSRNNLIRQLAARKGVKLIDVALITSNDDGLTWKAHSLHVDGDFVHYSEVVRDLIADQVFAHMNALRP